MRPEMRLDHAWDRDACDRDACDRGTRQTQLTFASDVIVHFEDAPDQAPGTVGHSFSRAVNALLATRF